MRPTLAIFVLLISSNLFATTMPTQPLRAAQAPGITQTEWHGYERLDFVVEGQPAILILPKEAAPGKPWVWRAEWFGDRHAPQVALELLKRGWHYAYINASDRYGSPEAMRIFDVYYRKLVAEMGLAPKMVMEGFSRGGLYAVNFAADYPDRVAALYLDAPALDLKSWPGYRTERWPDVAANYGLTVEQMETELGRVNPLERFQPLVQAGIPIIGVSGDADPIVRLNENLAVFAERYRAAGGTIEVIIKPGGTHSPHSLPDPTPVVDFILKYTRQ